MAQTYNEYFAAIGEKMIRVRGRNIWEAAEQAAANFSGKMREGLQFFRGEARMELARSGTTCFSGDFDRWRNIFLNQGRSTKRWDKLSAWAREGDSK